MTPEQEELLQDLAEAGEDIANAFFAQRATVLKATKTRDSTGSPIEAWTDELVDVPCNVFRTAAAAAATEQMIAARETGVVSYTVSVANGTPINRKHRLKLDDGRTLEVVAVPVVTFTAVQDIYCVEVA